MFSGFLKNRVLFAFFIFSFLSQSKFSYGMEMETTFFNVGQGNCTVVGYRKLPTNTKSHVLLVDAGSSEYDDNRAGRNATAQKKEISEKIMSFFPPRKERKLTIVLSHGDKDHYSWIFDILDNLKLKEEEINFICGGKITDYGKLSKKENLRKTLAKYNENGKAIFRYDQEIPKIDFLPGTCKVLAAIKDSKEKNDLSIVLKIKYAGKSLLLTGDATDKTIDSIKKYSVVPLTSSKEVLNLQPKQLGVYGEKDKLYCTTRKKKAIEVIKSDNPKIGISPVIFEKFLNKKKVEYGDKNSLIQFSLMKGYIQKVTLTQLTHHGASDKCNSKSFIEGFISQACVISAGIHGGYLHPKESVIKTVSQILPLPENPKYHIVRYYNDGEFPITNLGKITPLGIPHFSPLGICAYPQKEFGYNLARTPLMLFTTSTNGNITFSFKENEKDKDLSYPKIEFDEVIENEQLQKTLEKYSKQLTSLNLSNLKLTDELLKNLLPSFPKNLVALNLENNSIINNSEEVCEFIKNNTTLKDLNLYNNKLNNEFIEKIKETWGGTRGLKLPNISTEKK